jgi:hypothetical protein
MTPHSVYAKTFRDKQAALGLTQLCVWVPADQLGQIKALIKGLRPAETVTLQPEANLLNDEQQSGPMNAMAWFRDSCSDYIKETIAQPKPKKHQSVEYVTLAALLKMDETQDFTEEMFVKSGGDQSVLNADDEPDEPSKAEATQPQPVLKPEENLPNNDDATQPAPVEQLVPSDPSRDLEVSGIRLQYVDDWTNEEDGSRGPRYVGKLNGFEVVFVWPYEWVEDEVQWWLTIGGDDIFAPSLEEADAIGDGDGLRYVLDSATSLEHAIEDT